MLFPRCVTAPRIAAMCAFQRTSWWAATLAWLVVTGPPAASQEPDLRAALASYPHKLVYETDRDGNWELYLANADGSARKNLTQTPKIGEVYPKASPDGRFIAFCADSKEDGRRIRDVYYMKVDGSERIKIADDARDPCWSPDGKRIAYLPAEYKRFTTSTWATRGLRIYDLETKTTTAHPNEELEHLYTLAWPHPGWFVVTVHGGMGYRQAILAIEAKGARVHNLRLAGCRPDVTADGRRIAWGYGDFAVGVADLDLRGETPRASERRTQVGTVSRRWSRRRRSTLQTYHADWSPDGRYIVYSSGRKARRRGWWGALPQCPGEPAPGWNLRVADAGAKDRWVEITTDGKSYKEPDWVPVMKDGAK